MSKRPPPKAVIPASKEVEEDSDEVIEDDEEEEEEPFDLIAEMNDLEPRVRREVYGLRSITDKIRELQKQLHAEKARLEQDFTARTAPLFEERRKIVTGEREPTAEEIAKGTDQAASKVEEVPSDDEGDKKPKPKAKVGFVQPAASSTAAPAKGIPEFWLTAIRNHEVLEGIVTDRDKEALKALNNVTCEHIDNDPRKGFKLTFYFDENPFFTNRVLTKTYTTDPEDDEALGKSIGDTINWTSTANNLTVVIKQKKQRHKSGKGVRVVTREEKCESFFNFFSPPDPDAEPTEEEDEEEDIGAEIEYDYEQGVAFKDGLIPRAVFYYTGEAIAALASSLNFMQGDDDEEDYEEEEEEEEEEAPPVRGGRPAPKTAGKGPAPKPGGKPGADCKQQ